MLAMDACWCPYVWTGQLVDWFISMTVMINQHTPSERVFSSSLGIMIHGVAMGCMSPLAWLVHVPLELHHWKFSRKLYCKQSQAWISLNTSFILHGFAVSVHSCMYMPMYVTCISAERCSWAASSWLVLEDVQTPTLSSNSWWFVPIASAWELWSGVTKPPQYMHWCLWLLKTFPMLHTARHKSMFTRFKSLGLKIPNQVACSSFLPQPRVTPHLKS